MARYWKKFANRDLSKIGIYFFRSLQNFELVVSSKMRIFLKNYYNKTSEKNLNWIILFYLSSNNFQVVRQHARILENLANYVSFKLPAHLQFSQLKWSRFLLLTSLGTEKEYVVSLNSSKAHNQLGNFCIDLTASHLLAHQEGFREIGCVIRRQRDFLVCHSFSVILHERMFSRFTRYIKQ